MRLATFAGPDQRQRVGVVRGDALVDITAMAPTMLDLTRGGTTLLKKISDEMIRPTASTPLSQVNLLPPIPRPPKNILCVGMNYAEHVAESAAAVKGAVGTDELSSHPVWFTKAATSLCGPFDDIELRANLSQAVDWEVELVAVIGKAGRSIPQSHALEHIHSYTILNDVSARDIQMRHGGQFFKGKSLDQSSPIGPWLVTADEITDPQMLELSCSVNGVEMQHAATKDMIFGVAALISDISEVLTLESGDLIATGTPAGVGFGRTPPVYLSPGDTLESSIRGIGKLQNRIVKAPDRISNGRDQGQIANLVK